MKISASKPALNQHSQKLSSSKTIIMNVYNIKSSQSKRVVFPDTELIRLTQIEVAELKVNECRRPSFDDASCSSFFPAATWFRSVLNEFLLFFDLTLLCNFSDVELNDFRRLLQSFHLCCNFCRLDASYGRSTAAPAAMNFSKSEIVLLLFPLPPYLH